MSKSKNLHSFVQRLVGRRIYPRALNYYETGRVFNLTEQDHLILADVKGSLREPYRTCIEFSVPLEEVRDFSALQDLTCSCPFHEPCKHLGAVLIKLIENGFFEVNIDINDLKAAAEIISQRDTKVIQFDVAKASSLYEGFRILPQGTGEDGQLARHRLAFKLLLHRDALIEPCLVYIKNDGSDGQIKRYGTNISFRLLNEEENLLLREFHLNSRQPLTLVHYLKSSFDLSRISLFTHNSKRINVFALKKISIDFAIASIDRHDNINLKPCLLFTTAEGRNQVFNVYYEHFEFNSNVLLSVDSSRPGLFFKELTNREAQFFRILARRVEYTPADVAFFKDFIRQYDLAETLEVIFTADEVCISNIVPVPILQVTTLKRYIGINLVFGYGHSEVSFENSSNIILDNDIMQKKTINYYRRSTEYEKGIHEYIRQLINSIKTPSSYDFSRVTINHDFAVDCSLADCIKHCLFPCMEYGMEIRINKTKIRKWAKLEFITKSGIDWFDVKAEITYADGTAANIVLGDDFLSSGLISNGDEYLLLTEEDIRRLATLKKSGMDESGRLKVSSKNVVLIEQLYAQLAREDSAAAQHIIGFYNKVSRMQNLKPGKTPRGFKGILRDYQKHGLGWLLFLSENGLNGILADDMGLGKTIQTLAFLEKRRQQNGSFKALITVPVVTLVNWEEELKKFTPLLKYARHWGVSRADSLRALGDAQVILTTYHTLKNDILLFTDILFDYFILDESQNIKNSATGIFKAVRTIKANYRLSLTGTPIENNIMELWSQMDFLNPGLLGGKKHFKSVFYNQIEGKDNSARANYLKKLTAPFVLRRKKEEVLKELPEKEEIVHYCSMGLKQASLYHKLSNHYANLVTQSMEKLGRKKSGIVILEAMLRLRQLALFPSLVDKKLTKIGSGKMEAFIELADEILQEDHKILVFSQFVGTLKILQEHFDRENRKYCLITGSTQKRQQLIQKFQEDDNIRIFLLSLKAGGVGVNLTRADYVIIFDPWWNPAVETQAADRAHRIGQENKVTVYKLITKNTIEEKILQLQERKKRIADSIISSGGFINSLTDEELMDLFTVGNIKSGRGSKSSE